MWTGLDHSGDSSTIFSLPPESPVPPDSSTIPPVARCRTVVNDPLAAARVWWMSHDLVNDPPAVDVGVPLARGVSCVELRTPVEVVGTEDEDVAEGVLVAATSAVPSPDDVGTNQS